MPTTFSRPARPYTASPIDFEQEMAYQRFLEQGMRSRKSLYTYLRYLEEFHACNEKVVKMETMPYNEIINRWATQARVTHKYEVTSIESIMDAMLACHMDPRDKIGSHERIENALFRAGLRRACRDHRPTNPRELHTVSELFQPLNQKPAGTRKDTDLRAYWYLCIATGNRGAHVAWADRYELSAEGVIIEWRGRKVRGAARAGLLYRYEWSAVPPVDVVERIARLNSQPFYLRSSEDPGRYLREWLGEHGSLMPTDARTRMDDVLLPLVDDGVISERHFEELMDHTVETARKNYRTKPI